MAAFPHGVDGDRALVFAAWPLTTRVVAIDRFTGREGGALIAQVPTFGATTFGPPRSWEMEVRMGPVHVSMMGGDRA